MGITYGDHLVDSGHHDITPEQEREVEARAECARRGLDPDDYAADGVLVWMVVDQTMRHDPTPVSVCQQCGCWFDGEVDLAKCDDHFKPPAAQQLPNDKWLIQWLREMATEFSIDNKTNLKQHICWIAAARLESLTGAPTEITDEMVDRALNAWFASPPSETDQGLERSMRAALVAALSVVNAGTESPDMTRGIKQADK